MSRDVLLNVSSSAIELLVAMTAHSRPIMIDGRAASNPACRTARDAPLAVTADGGGAAATSGEVGDAWTAMALLGAGILARRLDAGPECGPGPPSVHEG